MLEANGSAITLVERAINEISQEPKENPVGSDKQPYGASIDRDFPTWYNGKKNGFPWCTQFHDAMFLWSFGLEAARKLLNRPNKNMGAVVKYAWNYYHAAGRTGNVPKVGASIFFQNAKGLSHIGIVERYNDAYVWTIEGNTTSETDKNHCWYVNSHRYKRTDGYIYGYGYPLYDDPKPEKHYEDGKIYSVCCKENLMLRNFPTTSSAIYGELKTGANVLCAEVAFDAAGNEWIRNGALWCCGRYGKEIYVK